MKIEIEITPEIDEWYENILHTGTKGFDKNVEKDISSKVYKAIMKAKEAEKPKLPKPPFGKAYDQSWHGVFRAIHDVQDMVIQTVEYLKARENEL